MSDFYARPAPLPVPPRLSPQQAQILYLIAEGHCNKEIAAACNTSLFTVHEQTKRLYWRLGAKNRTHAVTRAFRVGLLR
ncbi:DNA-binding NarL/FixJ family response regulator [Actinoplanes campanulatus]|uniref:DNA-binding NarL/FixJ family response regulator n=1 Tax=Actinoplanes campanulatus TaxID=113559 RepID=A0A7W5FHZ8_9ACTN|nr:LuxR C-terminal-related transcriptional regulator [Actinoplanes campanulatus]MBB3098965.1 DNA-binding NarL/FixJ family response regulator [Actinoplanes campanulatus]GGN39662.1 hypothetical protein GCM10010109_67850 [Actinoplanes campanulatus]